MFAPGTNGTNGTLHVEPPFCCNIYIILYMAVDYNKDVYFLLAITGLTMLPKIKAGILRDRLLMCGA
jgi:hypothetical protein